MWTHQLLLCSHHTSCEQQRCCSEIANVSKCTSGVVNPSGCHNNAWCSPTDSRRFGKVRGELTMHYGRAPYDHFINNVGQILQCSERVKQIGLSDQDTDVRYMKGMCYTGIHFVL